MLAILRSVLGLFAGRAPVIARAATAVAETAAADPASGRAETDPELAACEALWRDAMSERHAAAPFRREALLREVTATMMRLAGPELRRFCASQLGGNAAAGDDCAQRAFITFWTRLADKSPGGGLRAFLYGIAANTCRQERRDRARRGELEATHRDTIQAEVHAAGAEPPETMLLRRARHAQLERALARLDERAAFIVRMRLFEEHEYAEILPLYRSAVGGDITTPEGLRTAFFRAKAQLIAILEADAEAP